MPTCFSEPPPDNAVMPLGLEFRALGRIPARAPRAIPANDPARLGMQRGQTLHSTYPATGAINSSRRTGVQRARDQRQTPTTGLYR